MAKKKDSKKEKEKVAVPPKVPGMDKAFPKLKKGDGKAKGNKK